MGGDKVSQRSPLIYRPKLRTQYEVTCIRRGRVRWRERFQNLVTTEGLNKVLDATFKTGLVAPSWYVGLKGNGTYLVSDTMGTHAGWSEVNTYSESTRPSLVLGSIVSGSVDNTSSRASYSINGSVTIYGAFLADDNTKGGTTGTLYGVGDFASSRALNVGDTLLVAVTLSQL